MRLVGVALRDRRRGRHRPAAAPCSTAAVSDRPLIRCAPHSALISVQGTPQTFSVYDLKNVR